MRYYTNSIIVITKNTTLSFANVEHY